MITEISEYIERDIPSEISRAASENRLMERILTCNLGTRSIVAEDLEPPVPVIAAFGKYPLHLCRALGSWDVDKAFADEPEALMRSIRAYNQKKNEGQLDDFIFQFGPRTFLYGDVRRVNGCASTPEEAFRLVREFIEKYEKPPNSEKWGFQLIKVDGEHIYCEMVPLQNDSLLGDEEFSLHYPEGTDSWHKGFEEKLRSKKKGLSILEGLPGTGKTSYLRHLIGKLKQSHRFYFIPPASMGMLTNPRFIGFWAEQRNYYPEKKLAVILEDADAVLMSRGSDNRDEVSALLNLSDGMLGDFLSLHIICTINCRVSDIDQALLRPGRLICHREFERLKADQAARLATHLGKSLPHKDDYSLAEVFSGDEQETLTRSRVGFGG